MKRIASLSRLSLILACASLFVMPVTAAAQARTVPIKSVGPNVPAEIPGTVYRQRRLRLMQELGGCAAAIRSYSTTDYLGQVRFDPYFFYLTGIKKKGAMLLLSPKAAIAKQVLYMPPRDLEAERWTGYAEILSKSFRTKYRVDGARRTRSRVPPGLGSALRKSRCYAKLRPAFANKPGVPSRMLSKYVSSYSARTTQRWEKLEYLRTIKDAAEIKRHEKAIAITAEGHRAAARWLAPGLTERKLASKIEDAFYAYGATSLAFPSIVGSGPKGAILHWLKRTKVIQKSELVVVDIGAAYGGYAADITRTYPVSGTFSAKQRRVYNIVLATQKKIIAAVKPGVTLERLNQIASAELAKAGYTLKHFFGHFVGLQVHDVGDRTAPLEAGMIITVEPGIYLKGQFGVRIEDMVLVTPRGNRLLTGALPRTAAAVEAWMKKARR